MISEETKKLIEGSPVYIGSSFNELPNITVVDGVTVLEDGKILLCDVYMTSCKENLVNNPNVCLVVYDDNLGFGYKIFGKVEYFDNGKELEMAQNALKDQALKAKGAFIVEAGKVIEIK